MKASPQLVISLTLALLCVSCSSRREPEVADIGRIYNTAARNHQVDINPVIVIPGILGSKLIEPESKKSIWGIFDNNFIDTNKPENLPAITLPLYDGSRFHVNGPKAIPNGALDRLRFKILGLPKQQQAYAGILKTLGAGGFLDQDIRASNVDWGSNHFTCFQFAYDWRLSNSENAAKLHEFILAKRRFVQEQSLKLHGKARPNLKFNIVAHSMGGLVARYYLRYGSQSLPADGSLPKLNWAGAKHIEQLVMVGTPNSGSILALDDLLDGKKFIPDWQRFIFGIKLPKFSAAALATFPSLFELMPRPRHQPVLDLADNSVLDYYDPALWEKHGWGILDPTQQDALIPLLPKVSSPEERSRIAKAHLKYQLKRARQFHRAMDRPATPPKNLSISLIAGDAKLTPRQVKIDLPTGKRIDNDYSPGDGTVLRSSALADERVGSSSTQSTPRLKSPIDFHRVIFLPKEHLDLTNSPTFTDNLLYQILVEPKK